VNKNAVNASLAETRSLAARRRGAYGVDAPFLLPIPAALIAYNIWKGIVHRSLWPLGAALAIAVCAALGLYASRRGKFIVWERLLDGLGLRGDEQVLDLGCGRGAVLMLAARRLTTGKAIGVDLWRRADQSGNAPEATMRNAAAEGVADRVETRSADMTRLPFADESFDLVLSNVAIHNVKDQAGRNKVIDEAVRVLRPGGRLLIADLAGARQYQSRLKEQGMGEISRRCLGWRMWWSGPWLGTQLVSASKPARTPPQSVPLDLNDFRLKRAPTAR
jgi:SAM-dependent methyltransferase